MIVYFTGSISDHDKSKKNYLAIVDALVLQGHTVIAEHILNTTEKDVNMKTREERLEFHHKVEEWIQSCDCMIAETSVPSVSVGYEIAIAVRIGVPILILHKDADAPSLLAQHKSEHIVVERYTQRELPKIMGDFLNYVHEHKDVKFTFFLSHKYFKHIDDMSSTLKIPKSVFLRRLIEEYILKRSR